MLSAQKLENALNDWLTKVENQVNQIEQSVISKGSERELRQLENLVTELQQKSEQQSRFELSNKHLLDQAFTSCEELKSQVFLLEKKYSHVQRHLERNETVSVGSRLEAKGVENE